jgi:hypothetical protein
MNAFLLQKKFVYKCGAGADFHRSMKNLLNLGLVAAVKKPQGPKYYIADTRQTIITLRDHGYDTTPGKCRKL